MPPAAEIGYVSIQIPYSRVAWRQDSVRKDRVIRSKYLLDTYEQAYRSLHAGNDTVCLWERSEMAIHVFTVERREKDRAETRMNLGRDSHDRGYAGRILTSRNLPQSPSLSSSTMAEGSSAAFQAGKHLSHLLSDAKNDPERLSHCIRSYQDAQAAVDYGAELASVLHVVSKSQLTKTLCAKLEKSTDFHSLYDVERRVEGGEMRARQRLHAAKLACMKRWGSVVFFHYEWDARGQSFQNNLREAAIKYPVWNEAVLRLNAIILDRFQTGRTDKGAARRVQQGGSDNLKRIEARDLMRLVDGDNEKLPTVSDGSTIPPGFNFDIHGLIRPAKFSEASKPKSPEVQNTPPNVPPKRKKGGASKSASSKKPRGPSTTSSTCDGNGQHSPDSNVADDASIQSDSIPCSPATPEEVLIDSPQPQSGARAHLPSLNEYLRNRHHSKLCEIKHRFHSASRRRDATEYQTRLAKSAVDWLGELQLATIGISADSIYPFEAAPKSSQPMCCI